MGKSGLCRLCVRFWGCCCLDRCWEMPQDDNDREKPRSARLTGLGNSVRQCEAHRWSPRQESNLHLALRRHLFYPLNYREMDIFNG